MSYTSVLFPMIVGVIFWAGSKKIVSSDTPDYERKRSTIKKVGVVLVGISILYFLLKILGD